MKFAKWTFLISGIYGLVVLTPLYFMEERFGTDNPPPIAHPEFYYGFIGVALAWQVMFLIIGTDAVRYRLAMLPAILEKASYLGAAIVLFQLGRISSTMLATGLVDGLWGASFVASFVLTARKAATAPPQQ